MTALWRCPRAPGLFDARPELADLFLLKTEVLGEAVAPLLHQRLTIHDHKGRYLVVRYERTGDHGLACARWRDENSQIVLSQSVEGRALFTSELGCKDKVRRLRIRASIRHHQTASSLGDDFCSLRRDPTWDQETVEGFAIAADEPGGIPGGKPQTFLLVVRRVV